jgi:malonate decarboxylase beta subunit
MAMSRGRTWFEALAGVSPASNPASVLCAEGSVGGERARFLAVVPDPEAKFARARGGELGLEEGWTLARRVREAVVEDGKGDRRALVAIVDVPGQPYGYREELLGLHLALAAAVDEYATARLAGHPVVALVVGQAISGAFLAHGMQANRIIALEDPGVTVQVMSKRSTARVTRRSVEELDEIAEEVPATAYDVVSFARLGALHRLIQGVNAAEPTEEDVERVRGALAAEISSARHDGSTDLSGRLDSPEARQHRGASLRVRERLAEEWSR